MSQQELLAHVAATLDRLGVGYFVTGSWSSSLQGMPRSTHDLDVVVDLSFEQSRRLVAAFDLARFYVSPTAVEQALRNRTLFNVLDTTGGDKIDFWMLTDQPWDRSRFARRRSERLFGIQTWVSAPEDTILAKLRWCQLSGGSEKQLGDARGVLEVQSDELDRSYIDHWSGQLGIRDLWQQLQEPED